MRFTAAQRINGIREDLPAGERVLWQGRPSWAGMARHAFHVPEVALYFTLLTLLAGIESWGEAGLLVACTLPAFLGMVACALLGLMAWMSSRTTIYAITSRRVFMRVGIALPVDVNLPLHHIRAASLALHRDGSGDLPLRLEPDTRLAYLHLWPHARPWHLREPEPMMRSIADAPRVAALLTDALRAAHESNAFAGAAAAQPPLAGPRLHDQELGAAA